MTTEKPPIAEALDRDEMRAIYAEIDRYNATKKRKLRCILEASETLLSRRSEAYTKMVVSTEKDKHTFFLFGSNHDRFRHVMVPNTLLLVTYRPDGQYTEVLNVEYLWPSWDAYRANLAKALDTDLATAKRWIQQITRGHE